MFNVLSISFVSIYTNTYIFNIFCQYMFLLAKVKQFSNLINIKKKKLLLF